MGAYTVCRRAWCLPAARLRRGCSHRASSADLPVLRASVGSWLREAASCVTNDSRLGRALRRYDSHRESILRSGERYQAGGGGYEGGQRPPEEEDLYQYFTSAAYSGFGDGPRGFYGEARPPARGGPCRCCDEQGAEGRQLRSPLAPDGVVVNWDCASLMNLDARCPC